MHKKFLDILVCPKYNQSLELKISKKLNDDILEGELICNDMIYRIKNGIPRFINADNYSKNFGFQWNKWPKVQFEENNIGKPMENYTLNMLKKITEFDKDALKKKLIIEIGCGSGRFLDCIAKLDSTIVGIDNSNSIDVTAENLKFIEKDKILLIQCDAMNMPFKKNIFDFAYSIGVLHHTPSPIKCIDEIYKILKEDGNFALSVYNKNSYYDLPNLNLWRKFFNFIWPVFRHYPPLLYTYFTVSFLRPIARLNKYLDLLLRIPFPFCNEPDYKWSILDTFDSVTPSYQKGFSTYEVYMWLKNSNFRNIRPTNWGSASFKTKK